MGSFSFWEREIEKWEEGPGRRWGMEKNMIKNNVLYEKIK